MRGHGMLRNRAAHAHFFPVIVEFPAAIETDNIGTLPARFGR